MTTTHSATAAATDQLRSRCASIDLPTWRFDTHGQLLSEPGETGPWGIWLRSAPISRLIARVVAEWTEDDAPRPAPIFPGAWAVPFVEQNRRRRTAFTVALALEPRSLDEEMYLAACTSSQLDALATKRAIRPHARYTPDCVEIVWRSLSWNAHDLAAIHDQKATITGFTRQLTDCYETIVLLYSLGRSMGDLTDPANFVRNLCDGLHNTLSFGWIATAFAHDHKVQNALPQTFVWAGTDDHRDVVEHARNDLLLAGSQKTQSSILDHIPGLDDEDTQVLCQPVLSGGKMVGVIVAGEKHGDDPQVSAYDIHLLEAAAGYLGAFLDNAVLYQDQHDLFMGSLRALTSSIDAKDPYTCGHSERVAHLAVLLARAIGMTEDEVETVRIAGVIHDVGKIGVPEDVLRKQGKLTDDEFDEIKKHPEIGHTILRDIPLMAPMLPGVLHHHERWDGRGYPNKLAGDQIPRIARILALADTFDAMSSTRSYRAAMPREKVLEEIRNCAGTQFDPELAPVFAQLKFDQYDRMRAQHAKEKSPIPSPKRAGKAQPPGQPHGATSEAA